METFLPALAMITLLWKLVDFFKACTNWGNGGKNGAVTQLVAWVSGILAVFLFAQTDWAGTIPVGSIMLGDLSAWSQVVAGLMAASATSVAFDLKKMQDGSDSAVQPPLVPPSDPPAVPLAA